MNSKQNNIKEIINNMLNDSPVYDVDFKDDIINYLDNNADDFSHRDVKSIMLRLNGLSFGQKVCFTNGNEFEALEATVTKDYRILGDDIQYQIEEIYGDEYQHKRYFWLTENDLEPINEVDKDGYIAGWFDEETNQFWSSKTAVLAEIKSLIKEDETVDASKYHSDDDLLECGHNHYGIVYDDKIDFKSVKNHDNLHVHTPEQSPIFTAYLQDLLGEAYEVSSYRNDECDSLYNEDTQIDIYFPNDEEFKTFCVNNHKTNKSYTSLHIEDVVSIVRHLEGEQKLLGIEKFDVESEKFEANTKQVGYSGVRNFQSYVEEKGLNDRYDINRTIFSYGEDVCLQAVFMYDDGIMGAKGVADDMGYHEYAAEQLIEAGRFIVNRDTQNENRGEVKLSKLDSNEVDCYFAEGYLKDGDRYHEGPFSSIDEVVEAAESNKELVHNGNVDGRKVGISYFVRFNNGLERRLLKQTEKKQSKGASF